MNTERLTLLANRMALDVGTPAAHSYNQLSLGTCAASYIERTPELSAAVHGTDWYPALTSQLMDLFDITPDQTDYIFGGRAVSPACFGEGALINAITRIRHVVASVDAERQTPLPDQVSADLASDQLAEDTFA